MDHYFSPNELYTEIITNFTHEYINFINVDIFKAISFYKRKKMQAELQELQRVMNYIFNNIASYLGAIINKNNAKKITRLGDMHAFKCTILVDSCEEKFIYKPIQPHFLKLINKILLIFNQSKKFNFYILKILSKNSNGCSIEFIENETIDDANKYSYHYGALIFILTLLRGTDFHVNNIFSISSTPVIIDYETLFFPSVSEFKEYDVTATLLIQTINSLKLMNKCCYELIKKGINSAHELISENNDKFSKLINSYCHKVARVILKPTLYYLDLLKNSTHPSFLIDKEKRKKYLEECLVGNKIISSTIIKHEIEDLIGFNIPSFYFKEKKLYSSKEIFIEQNMMFSPQNKIDEAMNNLQHFKNNIIRILEQNES